MRSRRRFDSSSIIAHPANFDTVGEIVKKWCQELDIYLYIYIYDPLDNRYGFSISVQPEITSLFQCWKKKVFQKLAGLWLVSEEDLQPLHVRRGEPIYISLIDFQWTRTKKTPTFQWFDNSLFNYDNLHRLWNYIYHISTKIYKYWSTLNLSICVTVSGRICNMDYTGLKWNNINRFR